MYTLAEMEDKYIGKIGTKERDKFEKKIRSAIKKYNQKKLINKWKK